jgi:transcriptional regulator with XRE-family HTH domain
VTSGFGDRLRVERTRLGYGLRTLALATGAFGDRLPYTPAEVARWHHATHGPRADVLARLARLGFDVGFLLTGRADHAHHLHPSDGLAEARWPLAAFYGPDGAPRWPTPIAWQARETTAAALMHQRPRVPMADLAHAFASLAVARAWATWRPENLGTERRLAALATAWTDTFALFACIAVPIDRDHLVHTALQALRAQDATRARAA